MNNAQLLQVIYPYDEYRRWLDSGTYESDAELQEWEAKHAKARSELKAYIADPAAEHRDKVAQFIKLSEWKCECPPDEDGECDCDPYQEREELLEWFEDNLS